MSFFKNLFFSSPELSWRSMCGEWVNITPQNAVQHDDSCIVTFLWEKIALSGVRIRVRESLTKQLI